MTDDEMWSDTVVAWNEDEALVNERLLRISEMKALINTELDRFAQLVGVEVRRHSQTIADLLVGQQMEIDALARANVQFLDAFPKPSRSPPRLNLKGASSVGEMSLVDSTSCVSNAPQDRMRHNTSGDSRTRDTSSGDSRAKDTTTSEFGSVTVQSDDDMQILRQQSSLNDNTRTRQRASYESHRCARERSLHEETDKWSGVEEEDMSPSMSLRSVNLQVVDEVCLQEVSLEQARQVRVLSNVDGQRSPRSAGPPEHVEVDESHRHGRHSVFSQVVAFADSVTGYNDDLRGRDSHMSKRRSDGKPSKTRGSRVAYLDSETDVATRLHDAYQKAATVVHDPSRKSTRSEQIFVNAQRKTGELRRFFFAVQFFNLEGLEILVDGYLFQGVLTVIICLNAMFIGFTSDLSVRTSIDSYRKQEAHIDVLSKDWIFAVDLSFNAIFIIELLLRLVAHECRFFVGEAWRWNLFDATVVTFSLGELLLAQTSFSPTYIRILRLARVMRSLRMLRLMRFTPVVHKLHMMTLAILHSRMMLLWGVLVLLLIVFLFSVAFLNAVSQYIAQASLDDIYVGKMETFFGSLPMTMLTLFMCVAGGVDWWEVCSLLLEISPLYACIFIFFVAITVLAVLNVINAMFVNDAMATTRMDMDLRMREDLEETKLMVARLTEIFKAMDVDCVGTITSQEFVAELERNNMKMVLSLIGLHFTDPFTLFRLLDVDGSNELGIDEFVMGCLRLKGGAILVDMDVVIKETKREVKLAAGETRHNLGELTNSVMQNQHAIADLAEMVKAVSECLEANARSDLC